MGFKEKCNDYDLKSTRRLLTSSTLGQVGIPLPDATCYLMFAVTCNGLFLQPVYMHFKTIVTPLGLIIWSSMHHYLDFWQSDKSLWRRMLSSGVKSVHSFLNAVVLWADWNTSLVSVNNPRSDHLDSISKVFIPRSRGDEMSQLVSHCLLLRMLSGNTVNNFLLPSCWTENIFLLCARQQVMHSSESVISDR